MICGCFMCWYWVIGLLIFVFCLLYVGWGVVIFRDNGVFKVR